MNTFQKPILDVLHFKDQVHMESLKFVLTHVCGNNH